MLAAAAAAVITQLVAPVELEVVALRLAHAVQVAMLLLIPVVVVVVLQARLPEMLSMEE
jgi:hypothetical protein